MQSGASRVSRAAAINRSHAEILALQRLAGNAAVVAMLRSAPPSVQRAPAESYAGQWKDLPPVPPRPHPPQSSADGLRDATTRFADTNVGPLDVSSNQVATYTPFTIGADFRDPEVSTGASFAGGIAGPAGSTLANTVGLGLAVKELREARHDIKTSPEGSAARRDAGRRRGAAQGDIVQDVSGVAGNAALTAGGAINLAHLPVEAFNTALAAGFAAGAPATAIQVGRYGRKAAKAHARAKELQKLMADENEQPQRALEAAEQEVVASREVVRSLDEYHAYKSKEYDRQVTMLLHHPEEAGVPVDRPWDEVLARLRPMQLELQRLNQARDEANLALRGAEARKQERSDLKASMENALNEAAEEVKQHRRGAPKKISLRMIQAYAVKKNKRGLIKKIVNAGVGALQTAAAVANLVVAIAVAAGLATAGASVLAGTPVGWALTGLAAAVAISFVGYKSWRYFAKRWNLTDEFDEEKPARSFGTRVVETLAFWKKAGPSKREEYASALYRMAKGEEGDPTRTKEAKETIAALGLDWDGLNMRDDPKSATSLIAAKLAS